MAVTINKNYVSPIGFNFLINRDKYANLEYFCTGVNVPGLSLTEAASPYKGSNIAFTGERINFEELTIRFNVSENFENYIELFDWMHNIINTGESFTADATLSILTSHSNVGKSIRFIDIFPTSLDTLEFNAKETEIQYIEASANFKFTYFEFE